MPDETKPDLPAPGPPFEVGERIAFAPLVVGTTKEWLDWGEAEIIGVEPESQTLTFHLDSEPEGKNASQGMEVAARVTPNYRAWREAWQTAYRSSGSEEVADRETRTLFMRVTAEHPIHGSDVTIWQRM